ncbi:MAG: magnesium transporter [Verrucomicrobia bacterium]|nr:magnesium transporter [Verrucomicrobiota bacterium]
MLGRLLQPEIAGILRERNFAALREIFHDWPAADVAETIAELPDSDQAAIFRVLPKATAADVFEYLDGDHQERLLRAMGTEEAAGILNEMSPDDRTALLEDLPPEAVKRLIELLTPEERRIAQSLLNYPEDSVGRLMTPDYVAIRAEWTVQQVLDHVRRVGRDSESINVLYVTDEQGRLIDDIRIREFLIRPLDTPVRELLQSTFTSLKVTDDKEAAVEVFRRYDRTILPVTDANDHLLGVVTVDDMLDVAEAEATEDIQKLGGLEAGLEMPYLESPLAKLVRNRGSVLVVLFLGELLTATVMGFFESEIQKAVVLSLFLPLIISSGGNSGSQASTLIIRAMALGEVRLGDWWRVARRELASGALLGLLLGSVGFARIAVWALAFKQYGEHWALLGLTVASALVGVVLWGSLMGAMLPFLLRKAGFDPATSSAPFVATLVDVTGLIIYFLAASLILSGTLL